MDTLNSILENLPALLAAAGLLWAGVFGVGKVVVALTPNKEDDAAWERVGLRVGVGLQRFTTLGRAADVAKSEVAKTRIAADKIARIGLVLGVALFAFACASTPAGRWTQTEKWIGKARPFVALAIVECRAAVDCPIDDEVLVAAEAGVVTYDRIAARVSVGFDNESEDFDAGADVVTGATVVPCFFTTVSVVELGSGGGCNAAVRASTYFIFSSNTRATSCSSIFSSPMFWRSTFTISVCDTAPNSYIC